MKNKSDHAVVSSIRAVVSTQLPTKWGVFETVGFERVTSNGTRHIETALALVLGDLTGGAPLVRIHSQCFTGEILGSLRCDCRDQLEIAMQAIAEEGRGLVIYEHQEGRGIGLMAKLQAYALQDAGLDTVEANHALGFSADCRDFSLPAAILHYLGINRVRLLSNNPHKSRALFAAGIEVVAPIPCEAAPTPHSLAYLRTKKEKMGHALSLRKHESTEHAIGGAPGLYEQRPSHPGPLLPGGGQGEAKVGPSETTILPLPRRGGDKEPVTEEQFEFASIEDAIREFKAGRMIVVVDDEDRENEGDLTMAAEMITPEAINFMATHGRGLICLAMTGERLKELELAPMVSDNTSLGGTAFTVSIDVRGPNVSTGISAHDRAQTIKAAIDPGSSVTLCAALSR